MQKNIPIDEDALDCLRQARQADENWSQVIKRCVRPRRSLQDVLRILRKAAPSDDTLDAIDEVVARRRRMPRQRRV